MTKRTAEQKAYDKAQKYLDKMQREVDAARGNLQLCEARLLQAIEYKLNALREMERAAAGFKP